jgi:hypothetical protein
MIVISSACIVIGSYAVALNNEMHRTVEDRADVFFSWREFGEFLDEATFAIMMPIKLNI